MTFLLSINTREHVVRLHKVETKLDGSCGIAVPVPPPTYVFSFPGNFMCEHSVCLCYLTGADRGGMFLAEPMFREDENISSRNRAPGSGARIGGYPCDRPSVSRFSALAVTPWPHHTQSLKPWEPTPQQSQTSVPQMLALPKYLIMRSYYWVCSPLFCRKYGCHKGLLYFLSTGSRRAGQRRRSRL